MAVDAMAFFLNLSILSFRDFVIQLLEVYCVSMLTFSMHII